MEARTGSSERQCTFNSLRHSAFDHIRNQFPADTHSLEHSLEEWLQSADLTKPGDLSKHIPSPDPRNLQSHKVVPSRKRRPFQPVEPNRTRLRPKRKMADTGDDKRPDKRVTRSQKHLLAVEGQLDSTQAQGQNNQPAVQMPQRGGKKPQQQLNERVDTQKKTQTGAKDISTGLGLNNKRTAPPSSRLLDDDEQGEGETSFGQALEMSRIPTLLPPPGQMNRGGHSSSSRSGSPRKAAGQITQDTSISMDNTTTRSTSPSKKTVDKRTDMEHLDPPTTFVTPRQWEIDDAPAPVQHLWRDVIQKDNTGHGNGIIPLKLRVCISFHNNLNACSQSSYFYVGSSNVNHKHAKQENHCS